MNFSTSSDQIFLDQEQEKTKRIGIDSEMDAYQTVMFFCPYFTRQHDRLTSRVRIRRFAPVFFVVGAIE